LLALRVAFFLFFFFFFLSPFTLHFFPLVGMKESSELERQVTAKLSGWFAKGANPTSAMLQGDAVPPSRPRFEFPKGIY
jgi:hypothetical protein